MRQPKKGDLIRLKSTRALFTVIRDPYTKVYLDQEDHEMIAGGYGEYAGIWETAIDVICTKSGKRRALRLSRHKKNIEVISERII
jgi:hypothetical protein